MISEIELLALMQDLESDLVERTTTTKDKDKFCQAICAFSNDLPNHKRPGYLLIGVRNNGSLDGLEVTDGFLRELADIRSQGNILPLPVLNIARFPFPEGEVAVVEVFPSDTPPVQYKGRIYIRVGPQRNVATAQEERILSEKRGTLLKNFDAMPVPESTLNDLALELFEVYRRSAVSLDVIEENHRTIEEQLAALHFYDLKKNCPTVAGILLFGKNPRYFLPGAYIQYLLFPGKEITDMPIDQAEISGDLLTCLREVDLRIKTNIRTSLSEAEGVLEHRVTSNYPDIALKELVNNAIMHRDYHSSTPIRLYFFVGRVEIKSSGGLYGDVTVDTLESRSSYRNPTIADILKTLAYVNRFGYGIQRAKAALAKNGNPAPKFEAYSSGFQVTLYARSV